MEPTKPESEFGRVARRSEVAHIRALDHVVATLVRKIEAEPEALVEGPRAAVAAILRDNAGTTEVLFIQRAEHPHDPWSGHIAFPGGRHDPGDPTLLATVIRETHEEVGIALTTEHLVARLPDVAAPSRESRGALVVTPYVFAVRDTVALRLDPSEVADTLWVPLHDLLAGEGRGTYQFCWDGKDYDLPCFRLDPGQRVLWGMTYKMVASMLEALDDPGVAPPTE